MLAFDDISSGDHLYFVWLAAFAAALGLALVGVMCRICRSGRVSRVSWALWSLGSLFPVAVCLSDAVRRLDGALTGPLALVAEASLLAVLAVTCYLVARRHAAQRAPAARSARSGTATARWRLSWSLTAGNAMAAAWASACFYGAVAPEEFSPPQFPPAARWVKVAGAEGLTDAGTGIDLLKADAENPPGEAPLSTCFGERFRERVIEVAPSDDRSNCHGWVFAGGRFAVGCQDVDPILWDNQYDLVERPEAGDLIIYRDDAGAVVHSGIVRLAENDLVMVESKWGPHGRYLHRPLDQAYSTTYEFYRSLRHGHLISLVDEPLLASSETASSEATSSEAASSAKAGSSANRAGSGTATARTAASRTAWPSTPASCSPPAAGELAAKKTGRAPMWKPITLNPIWWPKRPPLFGYRPFPWNGPGAATPLIPGQMNKQDRG